MLSAISHVRSVFKGQKVQLINKAMCLFRIQYVLYDLRKYMCILLQSTYVILSLKHIQLHQDAF